MLTRLLTTITVLRTRHTTTFFTTRAMSTPDLKSWTRERLTALYTAPTEEFDSAFESALAPDGKGNVIVSGEEVGREKFKEELRAQRAGMVRCEVGFGELKEEKPGDVQGQSEGDEAASGQMIVKGTWTVTRSLKFRIRAAPAQMKRISTFEARVEPVSPGSSDFRIVHLSESVENKHAPVILNPVRRVAGGEPHDEAQVETQAGKSERPPQDS